MSTEITEVVGQESAVHPLVAALDSPQEVDEVVAPEAEAAATEAAVEETAQEGTKTDSAQLSQEVPAESPVVADELTQMRAMLRQQKMELAVLRGTVEKHEAVQSGEVGEAVPEPMIVQLQQEIAAIGAAKAPVLDTLLETMELVPKYEDVRTVCSRAHLDDIIEMGAANVARQEGISTSEAALILEKDIWSHPNPYKYMYELIKGHHPKYAAAAEEKVVTPTMTDKPRTPATAPTSIAGIAGGDGDVKAGWTSSKIDALSESDLGQVPRDIYEKYLAGELA